MRKYLMTTRESLSQFCRLLKPMIIHCLSVWLVIFFIVCSFSLYAQTQAITGRVIDEKSQPLAGVSVTIKETNAGTSTDVNGNFTIMLTEGRIWNFLISVRYHKR